VSRGTPWHPHFRHQSSGSITRQARTARSGRTCCPVTSSPSPSRRQNVVRALEGSVKHEGLAVEESRSRQSDSLPRPSPQPKNLPPRTSQAAALTTLSILKSHQCQRPAAPERPSRINWEPLTGDSNISADPPSAFETSPTTSPDHSSNPADSDRNYTLNSEEPHWFVLWLLCCMQ